MSKSGTIIIVDDNKGVLTAVEILLKIIFQRSSHFLHLSPSSL